MPIASIYIVLAWSRSKEYELIGIFRTFSHNRAEKKFRRCASFNSNDYESSAAVKLEILHQYLFFPSVAI